MKKLLTFVLTLALVFTALGATTAFAAEPTTFETSSTRSTNGYSQRSGVMVGGGTVSGINMGSVGTSPTFEFLINGNDALYVDVVAITPNGHTVTLFSNIRCDGQMHSVTYLTSETGSYSFDIRVNHGTSAGQSKAWYLSATW